MTSSKNVITPQQIDKVRHELGNELCRALELLTSKLSYEFGLPSGNKKSGSMRDYAELREAKSLVSYLKYPDPTETISASDMGWALKLVRHSMSGSESWAGAVFDKASQVLGLNLAQEHAIPEDLGRKISNELQLHSQPAGVLQAAL